MTTSETSLTDRIFVLNFFAKSFNCERESVFDDKETCKILFPVVTTVTLGSFISSGKFCFTLSIASFIFADVSYLFTSLSSSTVMLKVPGVMIDVISSMPSILFSSSSISLTAILSIMSIEAPL